MRSGEDARIFCGRADPRGPGKRFKARPVKIGDAAESSPASHGHEGFEFHFIRQLGEGERARPIGLQRAVDGRDRAAALEVRAEGAELELTVVVERIRLPACLCSRFFHFDSISPAENRNLHRELYVLDRREG